MLINRMKNYCRMRTARQKQLFKAEPICLNILYNCQNYLKELEQILWAQRED